MCACGDAPCWKDKMWALIAARNEKQHIQAVVSGLRRLGFSVLVVDDGSKDGTAEAAKAKGAHVVSICPSGKGAAIKHGLLHLEKQTDRVVVLDGDGQHSPHDALRLHRLLERGFALVVGNRMRDCTSMPLLRRLTNRAMSAAIRLVAGTTVPDSQCGLKALNLRLLSPSLFSCRKFDWETEVILHAIHLRRRMASARVLCLYRGTPSRIRPLLDALRFFFLLFRYIFGARMGLAFLWRGPQD